MTTSALADEGMRLFDAPPLKQLKEKYQFEPSPQWLEHLQKASVRFNSGGSRSYVSQTASSLQTMMLAQTPCRRWQRRSQLSAEQFLCETQADEIESTDLELNVLMSIEDVTADVPPQ